MSHGSSTVDVKTDAVGESLSCLAVGDVTSPPSVTPSPSAHYEAFTPSSFTSMKYRWVSCIHLVETGPTVAFFLHLLFIYLFYSFLSFLSFHCHLHSSCINHRNLGKSGIKVPVLGLALWNAFGCRMTEQVSLHTWLTCCRYHWLTGGLKNNLTCSTSLPTECWRVSEHSLRSSYQLLRHRRCLRQRSKWTITGQYSEEEELEEKHLHRVYKNLLDLGTKCFHTGSWSLS